MKIKEALQEAKWLNPPPPKYLNCHIEISPPASHKKAWLKILNMSYQPLASLGTFDIRGLRRCYAYLASAESRNDEDEYVD